MNKTIEETCIYGICDGSGIVLIGEFDDVEENSCACRAKEEEADDQELD